jgi:2,3-bisphosphoglycerate-dependent phosphoglycerate mutase
MQAEQHWPDSLWLVRHGESAGNVASDRAEATGAMEIDLPHRDMDVPLSDCGRTQARALGKWISGLPKDERPTAVLASPYVRAEETARLILEGCGSDPDAIELRVDERLREREFGVLDRLTVAGIKDRYPEQAEFRAFLGKFYHRPPGGESWADVVLRLRSVIDTITREYIGERLMVVTHQVVVMMFRYLFEQMREQEVLEIDRKHRVANCALTVYEFDPDEGRHGGMVLRRFNDVEPITSAGAEITEEADVPVAAK